HVTVGVTRKESPKWRSRTLPVKTPEKGTLTVAPAGTTRGTLNAIVAVMRLSGFPLVRDSIVAVPTVIRVSVDAWFVTVMRPTSLPSGPLGWTTFWTLARIVRFGSSNTLTVMRRRPGEAKAVPRRRTLRIGSGNRYRFRPHGAFPKVRMDFDGIELFPQIASGPIFRRRRPAGSPGWAPGGYNRADAPASSVVWRRLGTATVVKKSTGICQPLAPAIQV